MKESDSKELQTLFLELGYPAEPSKIIERFRGLDPKYNVNYVGLSDHGKVIAWVHGQIKCGMLSDPRAEIVGLVVSSEFRGNGLGRELVERIFRWAEDEGLNVVRVASNLERIESHQFYKRMGFETIKESAIYERLF